MADRAQEVAVRRSGEEAEIIPSTLQRPGQHQGLARTRFQSPTPRPRGRPQEALGGEVGHMRTPSGGLGQHPLRGGSSERQALRLPIPR